MKKILFASFAVVVFSLGRLSAQNYAPLNYMYTGADLSCNTYYGTARSIAMGNALTAVGGDLGSIVINPAGSAVASYSQVSITPSFSFASSAGTYSPVGSGPVTSSFNSGPNSRFGLSNLALSMVFKTGRSYGLKSISVGFVSSQTADYNSIMTATGNNSRTTLLGENAATATFGKFSHNDLNSYDSGIPWDIVTAYRARLFGSINMNEYVGNSTVPGDYGYYVPDELRQTSSVMTQGHKNDFILNVGADFSDTFYVGLNWGVQSLSYSYMETYNENPVNFQKFYISITDRSGKMVDTYYRGANTSYSTISDARGSYFKGGFIWLPVRGLRIGAAVQSPTFLAVQERIRYSAASYYENAYCDGQATSPEDAWGYSLRTPYSVNAGLAWTFGVFGMISVDYEMMDYSVMRMKESGSFSASSVNDYFYRNNEVTKKFMGVSHALRVGAEIKPLPFISVRAGYNLLTSPEKVWHDPSRSGEDITAEMYATSPEKYKGMANPSYLAVSTSTFSFGLGYSSPSSFYADLAVRFAGGPSVTLLPYFDYSHASKDKYHTFGTDSQELSPRIEYKEKLISMALTLGWRF